MGAWYATREVVKEALDIKEPAYADRQVDRCIESASRAVEGILRRRFYPWTGTRYFPWPTDSDPRRLWLDEDELISIATLTVDGEAIVVADYRLEPANQGPPYDRIELTLGSGATFLGGEDPERATAVTGVFGYAIEETPGGALAEALDASETGVDVTDSASVGVGSIIRVGTERMIVTGKTMIDTTQNLGGNIAAAANVQTVGVGSGAAFAVGETILIDAERMLVRDIAGNNLIVKRAHDGSTLAAHTASADIYAPRTLTVQRGALGTTAATHDTAAAIAVHAVPGLVGELCVALALVTLGQRQAGYSRTIGEGESQRETSGRGLAEIRREAKALYWRGPMVGAV